RRPRPPRHQQRENAFAGDESQRSHECSLHQIESTAKFDTAACRRMIMIMSTRMEFEPLAEWPIKGTISLTYDGASPDDPGPAGALVRMLIAQLSNDEAGLKAAATARTLSMGKPTPPGKDLVVKFKEAQIE